MNKHYPCPKCGAKPIRHRIKLFDGLKEWRCKSYQWPGNKFTQSQYCRDHENRPDFDRRFLKLKPTKEKTDDAQQ